MDTQQKNPQLATEEFAVHQLESRMSAVETYQAFYNLYGQAELLDTNGRLSSEILLADRALYCDESNDASTHLIVRQYNDAVVHPGRRRFLDGQPEHFFPYDSDSFVVVTTDGDTIDRWVVRSAYGIHPGRLDTVLNPYYANRETLYFQLSSPDGQTQRSLQFNRETGSGTMTLPSGNMGWILSEFDTLRQLDRIREQAPSIGHIATAS